MKKLFISLFLIGSLVCQSHGMQNGQNKINADEFDLSELKEKQEENLKRLRVRRKRDNELKNVLPKLSNELVVEILCFVPMNEELFEYAEKAAKGLAWGLKVFFLSGDKTMGFKTLVAHTFRSRVLDLDIRESGFVFEPCSSSCESDCSESDCSETDCCGSENVLKTIDWFRGCFTKKHSFLCLFKKIDLSIGCCSGNEDETTTSICIKKNDAVNISSLKKIRTINLWGGIVVEDCNCVANFEKLPELKNLSLGTKDFNGKHEEFSDVDLSLCLKNFGNLQSLQVLNIKDGRKLVEILSVKELQEGLKVLSLAGYDFEEEFDSVAILENLKKFKSLERLYLNIAHEYLTGNSEQGANFLTKLCEIKSLKGICFMYTPMFEGWHGEKNKHQLKVCEKMKEKKIELIKDPYFSFK